MVGATRAAGLRGSHFNAHMTLEAGTQARARLRALRDPRPDGRRPTACSPAATASRCRYGCGWLPARVDGRIVGVIGFARDSRARRDVEAQFMRSEQQFRSLFENHPDAFALHDLEGRFCA